MGKLTTHVLDTAHGRPGAGVKVALFAVTGEGKQLLKMDVTNVDGRCATPLLEGDALRPGQYELVFNGVELAHFAKAEPWPSDGPTIFFLGRHEPRKGLAVLLEAMAELPPSVRLWVAGDGPETDALRRRSAGDVRIEWLGRISEDEKARRLRGADVFCAPSLHGASIAGSGDMRIDRAEANDFSASIGGSGDMEISALHARQASFSVAGSGNISAAGAAEETRVSIAGSGDVTLDRLDSHRARVTVMGSGNVALRASEAVNGSVMGSGDVVVSGPARCSVSKMGSGDVRCGA